jgi:hypothetical protein
MGGLGTIRAAAATVALTALGCTSGADWHSLRSAQNYAPAGSVHVQFLTPSWEHVEREAYDALAFTTMDALSNYGIAATLWHHPSPPPPPAVLIGIESYDRGSRGLRWLCGGFGCGEAVIFVLVDVRGPPHGQPVLLGRVEGWVRGGWVGGSSVSAAEQAGQAIACIVARGSATRCGGFSRSAKAR